MSILLNIPIESSELAPWLEKQLTGLHLGQLVAELQTMHGRQGRRNLMDICGHDLAQICESGLTCLQAETLSEMLTNPGSLLELQEETFLSGSAYWQQLAGNGDAGRRAQHLQKSILDALSTDDAGTAVPANAKTSPDLGQRPPAASGEDSATRDVSHLSASSMRPAMGKTASGKTVNGKSGSRAEHDQESGDVLSLAMVGTEANSVTGVRRRLRWFLGTATVAALLLVTVTQWPDKAPPGWGFNSPDLLAFEGSDSEFLDHLADAAGQWSRREPRNNAELRVRLVQFSDGCQKLLTTLEKPLPQLPPETQTWLKDKCGAWKTNIDGHVAAIDSGASSFEEVRDAANATVAKLVKALRTGPVPAA